MREALSSIKYVKKSVYSRIEKLFRTEITTDKQKLKWPAEQYKNIKKFK